MRARLYPKYKPSGVEWLGDVPEHWDVKRLKMAVRLMDRKVEADEENPVPYIGMENIESWTGRLLSVDPDVVPTGTANAFEAGNTLFGKLRPYLAKACNPDFDGLCSTELLVLDGTKIGRRALLYSLLTDGFIKLVDSSTYGSKMPRASWDFIGDCIVPVAPPDEQGAIADFLDRETTKIDTLVAKKRALIDRLQEKRTALIARTVTLGLPPDVARTAGLDPHPKLKPSGIDWLGDVPESWTVTKVWIERIRRSLELQDGNHGELHPTADDYVPDGIPFVMANDIVGGRVEFGACKFVERALSDSLRIGFAREGDVLLTHKGTIGRVGLIQATQYPYVMLTPQVTYYRCLRDVINRFLFWSMQGAYWQGQMLLVSSLGTTRAYVGLLDQKRLTLLLPPLAEQKAIADFLEAEAAKIDGMVNKIETAIERLQEYRTALIAAAVTGKIDLRAATAA